MPRKSDLQMEELVTSSPVRRSSRLTAAPNNAASIENPTKSIKTRRSSVKEENNEKFDTPGTAETKPANRRRSTSTEPTVERETKKIKGRRSSASEEPKLDMQKEIKVRRGSVDEESGDLKVKSVNTSELDGETQRVTRRRRSLSTEIDDSEIKEKRITRTRRMSVEKQEENVLTPVRKSLRSRRSSVEKSEETEPKTPKPAAKVRRRGSISLDPIEENLESNRKSSSPQTSVGKKDNLVVSLTPIKKSTEQPQIQLDLSIIEEDSVSEEVVNNTRRSSPRFSTEKQENQIPDVSSSQTELISTTGDVDKPIETTQLELQQDNKSPEKRENSGPISEISGSIEQSSLDEVISQNIHNKDLPNFSEKPVVQSHTELINSDSEEKTIVNDKIEANKSKTDRLSEYNDENTDQSNNQHKSDSACNDESLTHNQKEQVSQYENTVNSSAAAILETPVDLLQNTSSSHSEGSLSFAKSTADINRAESLSNVSMSQDSTTLDRKSLIETVPGMDLSQKETVTATPEVNDIKKVDKDNSEHLQSKEAVIDSLERNDSNLEIIDFSASDNQQSSNIASSSRPRLSEPKSFDEAKNTSLTDLKELENSVSIKSQELSVTLSPDKNSESICGNTDLEQNIVTSVEEPIHVSGKPDAILQNIDSANKSENKVITPKKDSVHSQKVLLQHSNISPKSNKENIPESTMASPKPSKKPKTLLESEGRNSEFGIIQDTNHARISDVFKPKGIEHSFVEPMDVDEQSMLHKIQNTDIDDTMSGIEHSKQLVSKENDDESVEGSFTLYLDSAEEDTTAEQETRVVKDCKDEEQIKSEESTQRKSMLIEKQKEILETIDTENISGSDSGIVQDVSDSHSSLKTKEDIIVDSKESCITVFQKFNKPIESQDAAVDDCTESEFQDKLKDPKVPILYMTQSVESPQDHISKMETINCGFVDGTNCDKEKHETELDSSSKDMECGELLRSSEDGIDSEKPDTKENKSAMQEQSKLLCDTEQVECKVVSENSKELDSSEIEVQLNVSCADLNTSEEVQPDEKNHNADNSVVAESSTDDQLEQMESKGVSGTTDSSKNITRVEISSGDMNDLEYGQEQHSVENPDNQVIDEPKTVSIELDSTAEDQSEYENELEPKDTSVELIEASDKTDINPERDVILLDQQDIIANSKSYEYETSDPNENELIKHESTTRQSTNDHLKSKDISELKEHDKSCENEIEMPVSEELQQCDSEVLVGSTECIPENETRENKYSNLEDHNYKHEAEVALRSGLNNTEIQSKKSKTSHSETRSNDKNVKKKHSKLEKSKNSSQIVNELTSGKDTSLSNSECKINSSHHKLDRILAEISSSSDEDNEDDYERNEFIDDEAMEGDEETPSEDSNEIIDEGESLHSSESDVESEDEYDSNDSFICDDEDHELLSGIEYDLGEDTVLKPKKSRIINVENNDSNIINFKRKEKPVAPKKKSRIVVISSSSDEDTGEVAFEDTTKEKLEDTSVEKSADVPTKVLETSQNNLLESSNKPRKETTRKSSITILENVSVSEIRDSALSERISVLVDSFCTKIKKGDISMNLSLEYEGKDSVEDCKNEAPTLKKYSNKRQNDSDERSSPIKKKKVGSSLENITNPKPNLKRRLSKSVENIHDVKKPKKNSRNRKIESTLDSFPIFDKLLTDVKNRPKRSIKPSSTEVQLHGTWIVDIADVKPSTSIVSRKELEDFKQRKIHPKDFRHQMLYNSSRVKREDSKVILRKQAYY